MLFDNVDTAKTHGLDKSTVSSRVESNQVEFGLYGRNKNEKNLSYLGLTHKGNMANIIWFTSL